MKRANAADPVEAALEAEARSHERDLWALCYRMTGSAADAEDLVQETFLRALERRPSTDAPLKPWLVRVAMNLATDRLRVRKEKPYVGPWLPSPIDTGDAASPDEPSARYDLVESASFAFLLAAEALTPKQRAVLLLRDVFDYSGGEVAACLDLSEADVRTTHHRARAAMEAYDARRVRPTRQAQRRASEALERFMSGLVSGDRAAVEAELSESVRALSDSGGHYFSGRIPVVGRARVALFQSRLFKLRGAPLEWELRMLNGFPALVATWKVHVEKEAPRAAQLFQLGPGGRLDALYSVVADEKLTAVFPPAAREPQG